MWGRSIAIAAYRMFRSARRPIAATHLALFHRAEAGRNPFFVSAILAGALAALTLARFSILVSTLPPSEYGRLNIFLTFVNVAPAFMSIGLSWQYQRIARDSGFGAARPLSQIGHRVLLGTLVPALIITALIGAPFAGHDSLLLITVYTVIIAATTSLTILYSQISLGLGYRSLASFMLFAVNGGVTLGLLPIVISGHGNLTTVLGYWAIASLFAWGWTYGALILLVHGRQTTHVSASFQEGLFSLPGLVGMFLLIFLARYILGLNSGGATVSTFSISSTITDSAFLVAVSIVGVYSNRIMDGEHPHRSLIVAIPCLLGLTLVALAVIHVLLPFIGRPGYEVSVPVTLILSLAGVSRLFIGAWRARAVALRKVQASAWIYLVAGGVMAAALAVLHLRNIVLYAVALTGAFVTVAVYQWWTIRGMTTDEPDDVLGVFGGVRRRTPATASGAGEVIVQGAEDLQRPGA